MAMVDSPLTLVVQSSQLTSWFSPKKAPLRHLQMSRALLRCTEHASRGSARHHAPRMGAGRWWLVHYLQGYLSSKDAKRGEIVDLDQLKLPLASVGSSSCHVYNPEQPSNDQFRCSETCSAKGLSALELLSCIDLHLPSALRPTREVLPCFWFKSSIFLAKSKFFGLNC